MINQLDRFGSALGESRDALWTTQCITALAAAGCDGYGPEHTNHAPSVVTQPSSGVYHDETYAYDVIVSDDDGDTIVVGAPRHPS